MGACDHARTARGLTQNARNMSAVEQKRFRRGHQHDTRWTPTRRLRDKSIVRIGAKWTGRGRLVRQPGASVDFVSMPPASLRPPCGRPVAQVTLSSGRRRNRCCGLWSVGDKPLRDEAGHRAAWELKSARNAAHAAFDPLWQSGLLERESAYVLLAQELGITPEKAHMSRMDANIAQRVSAAVKAIQASLAPSTAS